MNVSSMQTAVLKSKPHYEILDGLRGVAAVIVLVFHLFEPHATSRFDHILNHGYLAVDFFFLLSGFVIGYAYDGRWGPMTPTDFFRRRLIRLHPMVIMGMTIGALSYYFQVSDMWPVMAGVPVWKLLLVMLIGYTLLPAPHSLDIRGWQEMHALNGPAWTLFYEYIANILYGLVIRRLSKRALTFVVLGAGVMLLQLALFSAKGDVLGGWVFNGKHIHIGMSRLLYPFTAGILIFRMARLTHIKHAFPLASLILIIALSMPRVGGETYLRLNALYESFVIIAVFPMLVYIGASGEVTGKYARRLCKFLGDISYPLYITHFPLIYIYWAHFRDASFGMAVGVGVFIFFAAITIAWLSLKLYDEPVRKWLRMKFQK